MKQTTGNQNKKYVDILLSWDCLWASSLAFSLLGSNTIPLRSLLAESDIAN